MTIQYLTSFLKMWFINHQILLILTMAKISFYKSFITFYNLCISLLQNCSLAKIIKNCSYSLTDPSICSPSAANKSKNSKHILLQLWWASSVPIFYIHRTQTGYILFLWEILHSTSSLDYTWTSIPITRLLMIYALQGVNPHLF
jgi:hypothetical protein